MDQRDFFTTKDWMPSEAAASTTAPQHTIHMSTPNPTPTPSIFDSRVVVWALVGVIVILVCIVVYLYFSTPKEADEPRPTHGSSSGPTSGPSVAPFAPKRPKKTMPQVPDEPAQSDPSGLVQKCGAARQRRQEELTAAAVASKTKEESVDDEIVTDGAVITNVNMSTDE